MAIIKSKSPRTAKNTTKKQIKLFKNFDYKITVESELIQTKFLDISFNILNSNYHPYNKPNPMRKQQLQPPKTTTKTITNNN